MYGTYSTSWKTTPPTSILMYYTPIYPSIHTDIHNSIPPSLVHSRAVSLLPSCSFLRWWFLPPGLPPPLHQFNLIQYQLATIPLRLHPFFFIHPSSSSLSFSCSLSLSIASHCICTDLTIIDIGNIYSYKRQHQSLPLASPAQEVSNSIHHHCY